MNFIVHNKSIKWTFVFWVMYILFLNLIYLGYSYINVQIFPPAFCICYQYIFCKRVLKKVVFFPFESGGTAMLAPSLLMKSRTELVCIWCFCVFQLCSWPHCYRLLCIKTATLAAVFLHLSNDFCRTTLMRFDIYSSLWHHKWNHGVQICPMFEPWYNYNWY